MCESESVLRGLFLSVSRHCFTVNDYNCARLAENKIKQLLEAQKLGFRIPATSISNDPHAIRRFLHKHERDGTVFKSFNPASWGSDEHIAINFTVRINPGDLPRDEVLQLTPAIYQVEVRKAYEVRVTCMGDEFVAVRLESQRAEGARIDWRAAPPDDLAITRTTLPAELVEKCQSLMQRLGLLFGCFDFIVTPAGEHAFLEINQMGQFLWIEEANPDIPLLQMFCTFLLAQDDHFKYKETPQRGLSFLEVQESAMQLMEQDHTIHETPEFYPNVFREERNPTVKTCA